MQRKAISLLEQVCNVGSGFFTALLVWIYIVKPLFHIEVSMTQNLEITTIFTVVSIIRGYIWRRIFNWFQQHWEKLWLKIKNHTRCCG
jgi:hypothetical protein